MPRPHFPARGGPFSPAWAHDPQTDAPRSASRNGSPHSEAEEPKSASYQALEAEIQRLRQELARVQSRSRLTGEGTGAAPRGPTAPAMLWVALAVSGAGLLFALLAILYHG
ncbi:MAG TPA: hypothetical protein VFB38_04845 [Chthonomonadaceae bacterium]|nr:hypothetical protein [Chthonomonadaceae bacterium]